MSPRPGLARAAITLVFVSTMGAVDRVRVERETQRLERLQRDLREVSDASDRRTPERHTEDLAREIDEIERRLRQPLGQAYPAAHEEYHRAVLAVRAREQLEATRLLRQTEHELLDPRLDHDRASRLTALKVHLETDLAMPPPDPERDLAASDEQRRRRAEREMLERRVADLRVGLRFWSRQRSGGGVADREERRRWLRAQIEEQRARLDESRDQDAR